jgi:hypothetical protein
MHGHLENRQNRAAYIQSVFASAFTAWRQHGQRNAVCLGFRFFPGGKYCIQ